MNTITRVRPRQARRYRHPRARVACPCTRHDMDYKAHRCDTCKMERRRVYFKGYHEQVTQERAIAPSPESAHVIDRLFIRAVWSHNPRKAQALARHYGMAS